MDETEIVVPAYSLNIREQFVVMIAGSIAAFAAGKTVEKFATNAIVNYRTKSAVTQQ